MPSSWHDIKREIFDRLGDGIRGLVPELNPKGAGGSKSFSIDCPECRGKGKAFLYVASPKYPEPRIKCNRVESCRYSKALLDYLMERDGASFFDKISELADIAGVEIPISPKSPRELGRGKGKIRTPWRGSMNSSRRPSGVMRARMSWSI